VLVADEIPKSVPLVPVAKVCGSAVNVFRVVIPPPAPPPSPTLFHPSPVALQTNNCCPAGVASISK